MHTSVHMYACVYVYIYAYTCRPLGSGGDTWRSACSYQLEAMAADGAQLEVLATNMEHLGQLLKQILQKDSFIEVRSNYAGHDGEKVLKREIVEEVARCIAVKKQKMHEHFVKMTMLKPVLENAAQLEYALKTWELTDGDLKAAVQRMELVHNGSSPIQTALAWRSLEIYAIL